MLALPDSSGPPRAIAKVELHRRRHRAMRLATPPLYDEADLLGRTKAELLLLARQLRLHGRSRLSKAELARALGRLR